MQFVQLTSLIVLDLVYVWLLVFFVLFAYLNLKRRSSKGRNLKVAFLHPFCNDGGGGEKVLWFIIKSMIDNIQSIQIVIYSLENDRKAILDKAKNRFNADLSVSNKYGAISQDKIKIIQVSGKWLLTPKPFLTMVFQIVLPMLYSIICLLKYQPDVFYDTTGYMFSFFIVKLLLPGTKCFAYVHYPFISNDMLQKIRDRRNDFNNTAIIAKYNFLTQLKIYYYVFILALYKGLHRFVDFAHCNSSWTYDHMYSLWGQSSSRILMKLYPPCNVTSLVNLKKNQNSEAILMSFAQFRPQKNQIMQIEIFNQVKKRLNNSQKIPKFFMVGTLRGKDDEEILANLKKRVNQLNLNDSITFHINKPYSEIIDIFTRATYGIHTMQAQHFGISVVEMMAAGLIVLAHNSAGPKVDIIKTNCGYLANNYAQYVGKLTEIINMSQLEKVNVRAKARKSATQFSDQAFMDRFNEDFVSAYGKKQQ